MKITIAKKDIGGLLPVGQHKVEITECGMELSKSNEHWKDQTPQLKVVMKNDKGSITAWMNLRGYKNANDFADGKAPKGFEFRSFDENSEKFLVESKTGKRVESTERTAQLLTNVGNLAFAAGIEEGEGDLDDIIADLTDREVGVKVRESNRGKLEAYYFIPADAVKASVEVED